MIRLLCLIWIVLCILVLAPRGAALRSARPVPLPAAWRVWERRWIGQTWGIRLQVVMFT